jgi:hypothetical protein
MEAPQALLFFFAPLRLCGYPASVQDRGQAGQILDDVPH